MNKFRFTINIVAIAILVFALASFTQAQATRTWVSGVGDDANPCSRTAPCKTFAGAISKTAKDGEIDALDPGGFGTVTITKSITIDGSPTGEAGVLNAGVPGVIINITDVNDVRKSVTLRSISYNGAGSGTDGIRVFAASKVYIEHCYITGNNNGGTSDGIDDSRTGGGFLEVYDCTIINNSGNGIGVNPSSGSTQINVHIYNSKISGNGSNGFFAGSNVHATIFNSVFTQNVSAGIFAQQTAGGNTDVNVDHCVASNNVTGFQANTGSSTIRVSNTTALGNSNLAVSGGGLISSYGNNQTGGVAFPSLPTGQS